MHSRIIQISTKPIPKGEWVEPSDFYENCGDFADYIGDALDGDDRKEEINYFAKDFTNLFKHRKDSSTLVYKGSLDKFNQAWVVAIHKAAEDISVDDILTENGRWRLSAICKRTHLNSYYRIYIENWNGYAGPMEDFIEWLNHEQLKPDAKLYIGAVIDYHF